MIRAKPTEKKRSLHINVHYNEDEIKRIWDVADELDTSQSMVLRIAFDRLYADWETMTEAEKRRLICAS